MVTGFTLLDLIRKKACAASKLWEMSDMMKALEEWESMHSGD
jgi:hypothetical protein